VRLAIDEAAGRGERPTSITVHAARSASLPDLAAWSQEAGIAFVAGGDWEAIAAGQPAPDAIDLMQGGLSPVRRDRAAIPRAAVGLLAAIALLQLAFTAFDTFRLQREARALESRREAIFREAFPEARVVVDPDLQMARNVAELQRARGLAAGDEFMAAMTRLARERGGPVRSVEYANGKVSAR
jgi:general secretion pathway protein L